MKPSEKRNTPRIILGILAFCAATALTVIEVESIKELKRGLTLAIIVFNYAGVAIFWIAGDLTKKKESYGKEAFIMSILVRVITFAYIAWMGKTEIVSIHEAGQMFATNLLLLFMEIMMNRYSDGSQQHTDEVNEIRKEANAWETQANADEYKRIQAEDNLKAAQDKLNTCMAETKAAQDKLKANESIVTEIQSKLNACTDKVKAYEIMKEFFESNVNTPILLGNSWYYHSSVSSKLYAWGRNEEIEIDGKKHKRPTKR